MKKNLLIIILCTTISLFLLTGCDKKNKEMTDIKEDSTYNNEKEVIDINKDNIYYKEFGSYEVLSGWVENEEHSTDDKFFYVKSGTENESKPNNVSVSMGTNKYSEDEHEMFKQAILSQISKQIGTKEGVELSGKGSHTKRKYILYTFTIKNEDVTTTLCYIVGDYKYVLVQETNVDDSDEVYEVTKNIVNTFEWND